MLFGFDRELLRESLSGDILTHDKFGLLFTCSFALLCSYWLWWCWTIPRFLFFCCWSFSVNKLEQRPSRSSLNWWWFLFYIIFFVRFFFLSSDFGICPLLSETGISKSGVISLLDFRPFNFAIFLFQTKLIFSLLCRYCFLLFVWSSFNSSLNKILVQSIHSELHFLDLPWPIPLQCYSGSEPSYLVKNLEMKTKVNHFLQILYHRLQFLMLKF